MLDTGVDVPEVMNLAFMKPVGSQIKFWQMIGRGTRSLEACTHLQWLPERKKDNFLIVDFWENFEHFNMMPKDDEGARQIPVLVTIFNTRLNRLEILLKTPSTSLFGDDSMTSKGQKHSDLERIIAELKNDISRIPLDSFTVKKHLKEVRDAWNDEFWEYIDSKKIEFLRMKVAPLLRFVPDVNMAEAFFTSKMERCALALLQKKLVLSGAEGDASAIINSIREDVDLLPSSITQVLEKINYKEAILSAKFWENPTLAKLDDARTALAPLMKYKRDKPSLVIELGLDDVIDSRKWVVVKKEQQKIMVEEYRKKVEEKIEELASKHPTIQRLKKGETVDTSDLIHLEQTLETELSTDELNLNEDNMLKAFGVRVGSLTDFLKHVLKLEALPSYEQIVRKAFDAFILEHNYNADQTRFLRTVQTVFMQKRKLEEADLYDAPFTNFGTNAVEKYFTHEEIEELMELTKKLAA